MSNHVHLLSSAEAKGLSDVVRSMKSFTSRRMIESIFSEPESRRDWMIDLFKQSAQSHKRNTNYQI
jgi:REP element-mobilizing transposase RayT